MYYIKDKMEGKIPKCGLSHIGKHIQFNMSILIFRALDAIYLLIGHWKICHLRQK